MWENPDGADVLVLVEVVPSPVRSLLDGQSSKEGVDIRHDDCQSSRQYDKGEEREGGRTLRTSRQSRRNLTSSVRRPDRQVDSSRLEHRSELDRRRQDDEGREGG